MFHRNTDKNKKEIPMSDLTLELLKVCKYQKEMIDALYDACESCKAHVIHEAIQKDKIDAVIKKAEDQLSEIKI